MRPGGARFQAHHPETLTGPTSAGPPLTRKDLEPSTSGRQKRVLIVHSDDDPITPATASRNLTRALGPAATLITLTDAGHTLKSADTTRKALNAQLAFLQTVMRC